MYLTELARPVVAELTEVAEALRQLEDRRYELLRRFDELVGEARSYDAEWHALAQATGWTKDRLLKRRQRLREADE
jgi:hypothetical protein